MVTDHLHGRLSAVQNEQGSCEWEADTVQRRQHKCSHTDRSTG